MATAPGRRLWPLVWRSLAWPSDGAPQKPQMSVRCFLQPKPTAKSLTRALKQGPGTLQLCQEQGMWEFWGHVGW